MRESSILPKLVYALVALCMLQAAVSAQYWFQTGVKSGYAGSQNDGASVYIQTVEPQNLTYGSFGFWVGEQIQNGAFLQIGYEIPNVSGYYPTNCGLAGCNGSVYMQAGTASWFWEYFPAGYSGSKFYGSIGGNNSAGQNGAFNRYSFVSNGGEWDFYVNGNIVGAADLGASTSGSESPSAFAELANTGNNITYMKPVAFKNLSIYRNGAEALAQDGYSYIGYGKNSDTALGNPYGVKEVSSLADYFEVGSGVPHVQNGTVLWNNVYYLKTVSAYGNVTGGGYYSTFNRANFTAPMYVYLGPDERLVFAGWIGSGSGSYSGPSNFASATMDMNITETATWKTEYHVRAGSSYGQAYGSGWYSPNSTAVVSVSPSVVNISQGVREVFTGWSNGANGSASMVVNVSAPVNVTAEWQKQYLVNLTTQYGSAAGSGWYGAGSTADISLSEQYANATNGSREAFFSWSGVYNRSNVSLVVDSPMLLNAVYMEQYSTSFYGLDRYSRILNVSYFEVDNRTVNGSVFLFAGLQHRVSAAGYKNANLPVSYTFSVSNSTAVAVPLPVYDVRVTTLSLFRKPLNASVYLTFANGTTFSGYSGGSGMMVLADVPLGYATGYARYLGVTETVNTDSGSSATLFFVTPSVALLIVLVVVFMVVVSVVERLLTAKKYKSKKR